MKQNVETHTKKKTMPPGQIELKKGTVVTAKPGVHETLLQDWGVDPNLTARDFVIPKILAMQAMSKPVTDGEAKMGEFRDSLNGVTLGDEKHPIEFVPFYMEKVFVVMKEINGKFSFHTQVPITPENEDHPFEEKVDGAPGKWYRTMLYYVLLPKELSDGVAIPYVLSFRSSSARAGQKLSTTMYLKNIKAGKTPASMCMELFGTKTTNAKGTYIVMDVREKRASTPTEIDEAFNWVQLVKKGRTKVSHADLEVELTSPEEPVSEEF